MNEEKKEIVKAAKAIKEFCAKSPLCIGCPFYNDDAECSLIPDDSDGKFPIDWRLPNVK